MVYYFLELLNCISVNDKDQSMSHECRPGRNDHSSNKKDCDHKNQQVTFIAATGTLLVAAVAPSHPPYNLSSVVDSTSAGDGWKPATK
jgi:hypothetical protein